MQLFYASLLSALLILSGSRVKAQTGQTNYVASTANASTPGTVNTIVGPNAGSMTTAGARNVFVGWSAGSSNLNGADNTFLGYIAGRSNKGAAENTFVGAYAGSANTEEVYNTFVGARAGQSNKGGIQNTFLGWSAGMSNRGSSNNFIGFQAGKLNTSGAFNTFIGVNAGYSNTTGSSNLMLGTNAGSVNTSGTANFFLGDNAGSNNSIGGYNVFLGTNAGAGNTVGANNTVIGFEANVGAANLVNATAIGFRAVASANNSLVLGNGANVGIGTSSPSSKLHIVSGTGGQSGLRLENLTSGTAASVLNQSKFLTVDESGNVVLGSTNGSARLPAVEGLWALNGDQVQNVSGAKVVIGRGVRKTPAGYQLFVEGGILTERVKVAVKNTSEWSDKVFAPTYKLTPLAQVEQYIQQNGHLPGVPSAQQMVEQGNDLHQTDARLLEKVEETMLYVLQLKYEVDQLRRQNRQLQRTVRHMKKR